MVNKIITNTIIAVVVLATAFMTFGLADGLSTYLCMEKLGAEHEASPLLQGIGLSVGPMAFFGAKIALASMLLIGVYAFLGDYPVYQFAAYSGMILSGSLVSLSNMITYTNMETVIWIVQASYVLAIVPTVLATAYYMFKEASKRVSHSGGVA